MAVMDYKELTEALGMSKSDIAEYFGVSERTVYRWETSPPPYAQKSLQLVYEARLRESSASSTIDE